MLRELKELRGGIEYRLGCGYNSWLDSLLWGRNVKYDSKGI